jgi:hypothetical protein
VTIWCLDTSSPAHTSWWWFFSTVHAVAWLVLLGNLLVVDIAELLGVKDCVYRVAGEPDPLLRKSRDLRRFYSHMRHPGFLHGVVLLFCHPVMTYDRFVLGVALVSYFLARTRLDEDDIEYSEAMLNTKKEETSPKKLRS